MESPRSPSTADPSSIPRRDSESMRVVVTGARFIASEIEDHVVAWR
jgi:hypothetical protein